jgi:DNA topoisomerase-1
MRTDSVNVAKEAQDTCREFIRNVFGEEYVPAKPNVYRSKASAQEAHEAIRPAGTEMPTASELSLTGEQAKRKQLQEDGKEKDPRTTEVRPEGLPQHPQEATGERIPPPEFTPHAEKGKEKRKRKDKKPAGEK